MTTGKIVRWNRHHGFGFIRDLTNNQDIFAQIQSFKFPEQGEPAVSEIVYFECIHNADGEQEAKNIVFQNRPLPKKRFLPFVYPILGLVGLIGSYFLYDYYETQKWAYPDPHLTAKYGVPTNQYFQCDGRRYCSQMTSAKEALFFQLNCPNTKMDGDRDDDPCESFNFKNRRTDGELIRLINENE